jgi:hypothetical protein
MDKQYNLEGWFKSVGSSGQSKIYFGYVPYDKDYVIIKNEEVHPILNTETTLFNDVNSSDTVVNITDGSGWDKTIWHSRIAFEIDDSGNYLDLPNRELSNRLGSDSSLGIPPEIVDMGDHWEVRLYDLSVGKSYPAGTKVRQHKSGGTYIYDGGSGFVPNDWTKYSGTTQGEMTYLGDGSGNDWRTGTKYAKIMVLPNHGQSPDSGYDLRIDDISLTTIPPTYDYRWGSGVYGSALEFNGVDEYMIVPMDNFQLMN